MKILMLTPYLPFPLLSGGQIRTYNLLRTLADKHEVTLFALIKEEQEKQYINELEKFCKKVRVFKRSRKPFTLKNILKTAFSSFPFLVIRNHVTETIGAVEQELKENKYDLIHAETFYMMPHIPKTSIPTILAEQTIEYLGYESFAKKSGLFFLKPLLNVDINKIKKWEKHYWNSCTKLVVMSNEDKKYIAQYINDPSKIEVVSNGVNAEWFRAKKKDLPHVPTILSVGTFNWLPNVEAVSFLVDQVYPLIKKKIPECRLWIVGNGPTKKIYNYQKIDPSITVTGGIPDIRDAFNKAHVLVAPVFSGKGTRYKILEALASKTPVVASNLAVEGLNLEDGRHVLTSDKAEELANLTIRVLTDEELSQKLANNGYKYVIENFDWNTISKKLDGIYQTLGT